MPIKILRDPGARLPEYKTEGSAGMDLCTLGRVKVSSYWVTKVRTGVYMEIPRGCVGELRMRSSIAADGIIMPNAPGTIDSDYRGEITVLLFNLLDQDYYLEEGERFCQLVILPVSRFPLEEVEALSSTVRGEGGLGSTGRM